MHQDDSVVHWRPRKDMEKINKRREEKGLIPIEYEDVSLKNEGYQAHLRYGGVALVKIIRSIDGAGAQYVMGKDGHKIAVDGDGRIIG